MQRARARTRRVPDRFRKVAYRPALEVVEDRVLLTYFAVTTTGDSGPGTLRAAITSADSNPGLNIIDFQLPAQNSPTVDFNPIYQQWTIDVLSPLPAITGQVTIDGYSQNVITNEPAANEVQDISLSGAPSGGTFTLTFEGETTAPIPYDASADQVGAALMSLPNIGQGNILATGGPVNTGIISVTFTNGLATTELPQITGDPSGLISSGTPPEVVTSVITEGNTGNITSDVNALTVGFDAKVRVILEGGNGGTQSSFPGLTIQSDDNTIRGLIIDGFSTGISISGSAAVGNLIQGDFIGQYVSYLNPVLVVTGGPTSIVHGIGNGVGVDIVGATNNAVGAVSADAHNAISGNKYQGVIIEVGADGNQVTGDLIGVLEQDSTLYYQVGNGAEGVLVMSSSNVIGGPVAGSTNVISANQTYGIHIEGTGAVHNLVEANYIGTDVNGTYLFGQGYPGNGQAPGNMRDGIFIDDAPDNQIGAVGGTDGVGNVGGNVISLNFGAGVLISGTSATGNVILGNVIGTGLDGARPLGNAEEGVRIESAGNTVGGVTAGSGNLISGNLSGVSIVGADATGNLIAGNFIGTDGTGAYDIGNATEGVLIDSAAGNTVGGTVAAARNLISGNNIGVLITNTNTILTATSNLVQGNYIGTDVTGTLALGNSQQGVEIDSVPANTIGGSSSGAGNLISANYWGVMITGSSATNNVLQGNLIGTDVTGKLALGNESDGVVVTNSAASNLIGGIGIGVGNTIAFNVQDGVQISSAGSISNAILSNSIFSNGGLGINLVPTGSASGPNMLLNSPTLTSATSTSSGLELVGTYTGAAASTYMIQIFASPSAAPSGIAEGENFLETFSVTTNSTGSVMFTEEIPVFVPPGQFVTATATDTANNTSEFSASITNDDVPGAFQFSTTDYEVNEAQGSITITVLRANPGPPVTVNYATGGGTAVPGVRYIPVSGTLDFAEGVTGQTFTIPIIDYPGLQGNQTVGLSLSSPTGGATLGTPSTATLTIQDDRRLTDTTVTTTEDSGPGSLRWAITNADADAGPETINFLLPAQNVPNVVDYSPIEQEWTIAVDSPLPALTGQITIDGYSQNVITNVAGANEVQSISLSGLPSGGTFTLTFDGQTTAPIPYDATADQVGAALMSLPNIGQGNIVATVGPVNIGPVLVTFTNALATTDLPQITGDPSGLTSSGTPPGVVTSVLTAGNSGNITSDVNTLTVGFDAQVRVILEGINGGTQASFAGLTIDSAHNIVRGLIIDGFSTGISIQSSAAVGNLIQGNFVGQYVSYLNPVLTVSGGPISTVQGIGNGVGVDIVGATNNVVGGVSPDAHNAMSGNVLQGVRIEVGANGNQVTGDLIGVLEQDSTLYYQVGNGAEGVLVMSSSNVIGGAVAGSTNIISANQTYGIHIEGTDAVRNLVEANYIGTDINGTYKFGQGSPGNGQDTSNLTGNMRDGIFIDNAPDNQIGTPGGTAGVGNAGGNVIAMNFGAGILISGTSATGNVILGNIIGSGIDGARPLGNAQEGVRIESARNTVGGVTAGYGNLISGNLSGVSIVGADATGNLIAGNSIGTDGTGTYGLGNATEGVLIDSGADNTVGGTVAAARNLISGNNIGVLITNTNTTLTAKDNLVLGNYIGTNISGALALGNSQQGVEIDSVPANTIGGSSSGAGNLISANYWGLVITGSSATNEVVQGNFIGTDFTGKLPLGNESDGVLVTNGSARNLIGGIGVGVGNTIGFNVQDGVQISSNGSISNAILSNSIFSNGGLGINLVAPVPPSPLPPNLLLIAPTLTSVASTSNGVNVSGMYTGAANSTYLIQFFASPNANPSGIAEGQQFLGTLSVTTGPNGVADFTAALPAFVPAGQLVTATATDSANDTSEFSVSIYELVGSIEFSMTAYYASQADADAVITVTRMGGSGGFATVGYEVSGGTAALGTDFAQAPGTTLIISPGTNPVPFAFTGTLVFDAGIFTETFTIPLLNDGLHGPTKTVNLSLQNPTGAATIGSPATATLYIVNANLPGAFQFSMANYQVNAAAGSVSITVLRPNPGPAASVNFSTGAGTAVPGVEYTPVSGTLFFAQGQTSQNFTIPIIDNQSVKVDETVELFLSSPTGGATLGAPSTATLTIQPDLLDRTGPTVLSIRFITHAGGVITKLVVAFDKPLNPTTAVNLVNYGYSVRTAGRDHIFGTGDDLIIPIIAAVYDSSNWTVTLTLERGIHPPTPFLFTINESTSIPGAGIGVSSLTGNLLDGNYSGVAGTPFSAILTGKSGGFNAPAETASATSVVVPSGQSAKKKRVVVVVRHAHTTAVHAPARVVHSDRRLSSHPKGPRG